MPTRDGRTECRRDRCEQYPRLQVAVARGDVARRVQPARVALVPRRAATTGHAALERLLRGGLPWRRRGLHRSRREQRGVCGLSRVKEANSFRIDCKKLGALWVDETREANQI